jgi:hypothetical protein
VRLAQFGLLPFGLGLALLRFSLALLRFSLTHLSFFDCSLKILMGGLLQDLRAQKQVLRLLDDAHLIFQVRQPPGEIFRHNTSLVD